MFSERATKTRSGATRGDVRPVKPKMFAVPGDDRCPIQMYKLYKSHRPADMLVPDSRFYLRSLDNPRSDVWYSHQPVGKDTLGKYMKLMAEKGNLEGRLVNHSTRKTFATSLREAGVTPNEIAQLGGWKNLQSINHYSVPSMKTQKTASKALSSIYYHDGPVDDGKENCPMTTSLQSRKLTQYDCQSTTACTSALSTPLALFPGANISGGVINVNVSTASESSRATLKRKVNVIYSESESSQE